MKNKKRKEKMKGGEFVEKDYEMIKWAYKNWPPFCSHEPEIHR